MTLASTRSRNVCKPLPYLPADSHRLFVSGCLEFPERIGVPDHPAGLPVHCTGDLGVEER